MQSQTWDHIIDRVPYPLRIKAISKPIIARLNKEITKSYEDTIRNTNSKGVIIIIIIIVLLLFCFSTYDSC